MHPTACFTRAAAFALALASTLVSLGCSGTGPGDGAGRPYAPYTPSTSGTGSSGTTSPPSSSSGSPGSGSSDGPLRIVSLSVTAPILTLYPTPPGETVKTEILAIVTHAEGNERVAGGQLEDATGHVFGAFEAAANKSTLVLALDWMAISAVTPLTASKGEAKSFTAKFFDNDGHKVSKSIDLTFQCRVLAGALPYLLPPGFPAEGVMTGAYDGKCFSDAHCGKSGVACGSGTSCSVRTEACEPVTMGAAVGCVAREEYPWLRSSACSCGGSLCTPGSCTCNP